MRLMEMSFAIMCSFAPHRRPHYPVLVHRLAPLLHASFRPRLATTPLHFAITSPQVVNRTCSSQLSIMLGTHKKGVPVSTPFFASDLHFVYINPRLHQPVALLLFSSQP